MLTDADFVSLLPPTTQSMDVVGFTPAEQVDPMYFDRSYYLEPEPAGTKPYVLLSEAMQQSGRIAIVKVALRQRETLGALRVRDRDALDALIQAKLDGGEVLQPTAAEQKEGVTRLLAALQQTVIETNTAAIAKAKATAEKAREARTRAKKTSAKSKAKSHAKTS